MKYPKESKGTKMAREAREMLQKMNLSHEEKDKMLRRAFKIIYAKNPQDNPFNK